MTHRSRQSLMLLLSILLLALAIALPARAQQPLRPKNSGEVPRIFTATCDTSSAPFACTIQQPSTNASKVRLISAAVYCAVTCEVIQARGGTPATATAVTIRDVNGKGVPARATVYSASDVGVGSIAVDGIIPSAGIETTIPYRDTVYLLGNGTTLNYTWRLATPIDGHRFKVIAMWEEYD